MGQLTAYKFAEMRLVALNARADALSKQDVSAWEEAIDWGVPDCSTLSASERRMATAPELD